MKRTVLQPGQPVRNLQHFLRLISYYYNTVPAVIPDGIFSEQTQQAVRGFQQTFNMPVTGQVNFETWNKIISVYNDLLDYETEPLLPNIFPSHNFAIMPNESHIHLYPIQAMLHVLTLLFNNISKLTITGTHDDDSVCTVKDLQGLCGLDQDGVIDKKTFNMICSLYNSSIPRS